MSDAELPASGSADRTWRLALALGSGLMALVVSIVRPLSFDEAYWLTMGERILGAGDLPYFDLLDNKGPLLYLLVVAALALPIGAEVGLSVLFAAACTALAAGTWQLAASRGQPRTWRVLSVLLVTVPAMALSTWSLTTELLSVTALVWAFSRSNPWPRVALVLVGCLIDPRVVLLAPVVLVDGRRRGHIGASHVATFAITAVLGVGTVVAVPALRYAFLDASLATRFGAATSDILLVGVAAVTPVLILVVARVRAFPLVAIAASTVAVVIGLSSGLPFGHYWVYIVLAIPLSQITGHRFSQTSTTVVGIGIVLVTSLATRQHLMADLDREQRDAPTASAIAALAQEEDRVLIWGSSPLLRVPIAEQSLGFAPTSNYFAWGLPEPDMLLDRLGDDLATASVVVVHPDLDGYRHLPTVAAALDMIDASIAEATCSFEAGPATVYRFGTC